MKKKQMNDVPADVSAKMKELENYAVMTVMRLDKEKGDE